MFSVISNCEPDLLFHDGGPCHTKTNPTTCSTNQWTGFFYMIDLRHERVKIVQTILVIKCSQKSDFTSIKITTILKLRHNSEYKLHISPSHLSIHNEWDSLLNQNKSCLNSVNSLCQNNELKNN